MESHRWGDYELISVLGKGGMGIVYKGRQVSLDRPVAVKVLPKTLTTRKDFVDRFYREAKSVAKINCPQIIQVFGAGEFEGKHYFAMEFVEGEDLAEKLKAGTKFENPKILHIVREVARALAAAGEKNIIHRDIKPANIMLTRKGTVKVMDFGLAKIMTEGSELTQAGVVMGTVNYLSPEQGQGKPCDPRTDLYSLGVVMYELLTGKVPFAGDNASSVIYQHIHTTPPLPTVLNENIPKEVESIVLKCLQKDPNMRYFSARELIRDIEAIESGKPPKTALMDMKTLKFKKQKSKGIIIAAAIAAALLIVGGLFWFLYPDYIKPLLAGNGVEEPTEEELLRQKELEEQKLREAEARKALESELAQIEEKLKTNRLDELRKIETQLKGLAEAHPEHAQIPVLLQNVGAKMAKIRERDMQIEQVEGHLTQNQFAEAEAVAVALVNEYPGDVVVKELYAKVKKQQKDFSDLKAMEAEISKELENARALVELKSYKLAMKKYETVLLLDPKNEIAQKGRLLCQEKIEEAAAVDAPDKVPDQPAGERPLTGAEQVAITECTNYYNSAEQFFQQKDYINALSYVEKTLAVEGIGHIQAAVEKKKQAMVLKTKIESILDKIERDKQLKARITTLRRNVDLKAGTGKEMDAVGILRELAEIDPARKAEYLMRIEKLLTAYDRKISAECLNRFNHYISKADLGKLLEQIDKESMAFFKRQETEFAEFFGTFAEIESGFDVQSIDLAQDRNTCKIGGVWSISFMYPEEKTTTAVAYTAEFLLVKRNGRWSINGANTARKDD